MGEMLISTYHYVGAYTFGPILREQQKAQEVWKNPGYVQ